MKKLLLMSVLSLVLYIVFAKDVQANAFMDFFFPSLRELEENPYDTLQAPFADHDAQSQKDLETDNETSAKTMVALDLPHRDLNSLSAWVTSNASEVLTFNAGQLDAGLEKNRPHFDVRGLEEFKAFLDKNNISKNIQSGQYNVRSFVEEKPLLLNQGKVGGRYRWLYEVPIMLSYIDSSAKDYKKTQPTNANFVINLQVGRSKDGDEVDGLLIEHWTGKSSK